MSTPGMSPAGPPPVPETSSSKRGCIIAVTEEPVGDREGDPVVDLGDLPEIVGRILGHEGDAIGVGQGDERSTARDPLPGEVRPILHELFG